MDGIELIPYETSEVSEGTERLAVQALDDATYEPRAYVEQTGDSAQAEAIQGNLTAVVETVVSQVAVGEAVTELSNPQDGHVGDGHGGYEEGEDGGDSSEAVYGVEEEVGEDGTKNNITPINLPNVRMEQNKPDYGAIENAPNIGRPGKIYEGDNKAPSGGDDDEKNVTPINLPNVRAEQNKPNNGFIENAPSASTPGKFDQDTGEFVGPTSGMHTEGEEEPQPSGKPSMTLQESGEGQAVRRDFKGVPQEAPQVEQYQVSQPGGRVDAGRAPLGPRPEKPPEVPPKVDQTEGKQGSGANVLSGPQQLLNINPHFADQALGAIGMGPHGMLGNGEVKGMQGKAWGYGPGAPGRGVPGGPDMEGNNPQDLGQGSHGSSGSGAPVHHYSSGIMGSAAHGAGHGIGEDDEYGSGSGNSGGGTSGGGGVVTIYEGAGSKPGGTGGYVERLQSINPGAKCVNSSQGVICKTRDGNYHAFIWNTIDGGNPMPYTGNWSAGKPEPRDPGIFGGTQEIKGSGHFAPVVSHDGGGGGGGGGGDPSIWDDGNWYGGIFGGGWDGTSDPDPGGWDYYTPDVIENLTKK